MVPKCLTADDNAAQRPNLFRQRPVILLQPLLNSWAAIIAAGDLPFCCLTPAGAENES
jgi:hypothetical protein